MSIPEERNASASDSSDTERYCVVCTPDGG